MFGPIGRAFSKRSIQTATTPDQIESMIRQQIVTASNGIDVTSGRALRVPEVLACVNVLAQSMSMLPFNVFEKKNGSRLPDKEDRIYQLLSQKPNDVQSPFEFMRLMTWHAAAHGNSYAHITRIGGRPLKLTPLTCKVKSIVNADWSVEYDVYDDRGIARRYNASEIFHLRGPIAVEAHVSESPVAWCRDAIATLIVVHGFTGRFFKGGARAKGAFRLPDGGALENEAFERLKTELQSTLDADGTPLLEQGLDWVSMDYSARDALLSDIWQQQVMAICRIWRIQPHLIHSLANATFSNIEQQSREFVDHTLMPWIRLWESAIKMQLMDPTDEDRYPKFSVQGLLRGDNKTRFEGFQSAVGGPWLTANEARELEDMNKIDGGDDLIRPLNMGEASGSSEEAEDSDAE